MSSLRDREHRPEGTEVPIAEVRLGPSLEVLCWYPEFLADEYGYHEWVRAATAADAAAALKELWGEGVESPRDWAELTAELDPVWMRQEAMSTDSPHFSYAQAEQETPHPITWNEVPEGTPGAQLYWRYGG